MAQSRRTTVYFDPTTLKGLVTSRSVLDIVNDAVRGLLAEDAEDLAACEERGNEPLVSYEALVRELKANGRI